MRKRILLVIGLTLAGMLAIIVVVTRVIIVDRFEDLQTSFLKQDVGRFLSAITDDLEAMNGVVGDWAEWDETYEFSRDGNGDYVRRNLGETSVLLNLQMNLFLVMNEAGAMVYGRAIDLATEEEIPLPAGLTAYLTAHPELSPFPGTMERARGIVLLPEGPVLVCMRPILDSRGNGPARGVLIMGRFLDAAYVGKLSRRTWLELALQPLSSPEMPKDFREAEAAVTIQTPIVIRPLTLTTVAAYARINDLTGAPVLLVRVAVPRSIDSEGYKTLLYFVVSILGIGVVFGAVVLLFLEKALISRLHALSAGVLTVGTSNDFSQKVPMSGTDELAYLGAAINGMLTALEQSSADLRRSEARNEALLAATPDMIARLAEDGTILDFRWPASFPIKAPPRDIIGTNIAGIPFAYPPFAPELIDRILAAIGESIATGTPRSFDFPTEIDGTTYFMEVRVVAGAEKETAIFVHDGTAEKMAHEAQKNEILLKEIHHRVKNNLQVISSLLDLQARSAGDERSAALLRESQDRLRSMSLIHEKLYREGNATGVMIADYIRDLALHLRTSFSGSADAISLETDIEDISLDMDIAVPCGLIITELVSNALKYAFPEGRTGKIRISFKRDVDRTAVLGVRDNGIGLPAELDYRSPGTLGLRIVNILVTQLKGALERERVPGTSFLIRFPDPTPSE